MDSLVFKTVALMTHIYFIENQSTILKGIFCQLERVDPIQNDFVLIYSAGVQDK